MNFKSFMFWSSVLTLPLLFIPRKREPGVVEPGPEDDDGVVLEPSKPPEPFDPEVKA